MCTLCILKAKIENGNDTFTHSARIRFMLKFCIKISLDKIQSVWIRLYSINGGEIALVKSETPNFQEIK